MKEKGRHLLFLASLPPPPHQCHLGCSRQKQPHLYSKSPSPHRDTHSPVAHGRGLGLKVSPQGIPDINL